MGSQKQARCDVAVVKPVDQWIPKSPARILPAICRKIDGMTDRKFSVPAEL